MSAKYKSPSFLLPNELNTNTNPLNTDGNPANDTGINSLYSMDFNGSSQYIKAGSIDITGNKTLSMWFKTVSVGVSQGLFEMMPTPNTSDYLAIWIYQSKILAASDGTPANSKISSTLSNNTWYHLVVEKSAGVINKIYINGVEDTNTASSSLGFVSGRNNLYIGAGYIGSSYAVEMNGKIDEVAIFNRALNTTEISALYGGTSPNIYPSNLMSTNLNPVAYYPLGEQAQNSGYPGSATPANNVWQFPNGVLQDYVMDFDSTSPGDYISAPMTMLNSATQCTISFWGKKDASNKELVVGGRISVSEGIWIQWYSDGNIYFSPRGTGGGGFGLSYAQSYDTNWHHYLAVYNGSSATNCKLYLDGDLVATGSGTAPSSLPATTGDNFQIGALSTAHYTDGQISNVAVWNTAITDSAQIANIYNNGSPQTNYTVTPQNWWKLNADSVYTPSAPNYTTALDFVASQSDYIDAGNPASLQITGELSISLWFKTSTTPTTSGYLISKGVSPYTSRNFGIWFSSSNTVRAAVNGVSGLVTSPASNYNDDNWHHCVFTFTPSTSTILYIDGSAVVTNEASIPSAINNITSNLEIGRYISEYFDGEISNVALFNSALTPSQVSTLFNFGTPETNISFSPQAWWKLNDQTAITDYSGNGNTGTNNGAADAPGGVAVTPSWKIPTALTIPTINYTTALDLNGSSDYIDVGAISLGSTFSLSTWIKPNAFSASTNVVFGGGSSNYAIAIPSSTVIYVNFGGSYQSFTVPSISTTDFTHILFNRTGANGELFINGISQGTTSSLGTNSFTINYLGCENQTAATRYYFDGELSNAAIFNTALISSQVSTLYNSGQPETAISFSPVSWWKLDTGGSTITDYGSGGNNGTNNGATQVTSDVYVGNIPVNGVSTTLPSTALQQSDLQFDSPYSNYSLSFDGTGDYIDCTDNDIFSFGNGTTDNPFSLSTWINMNTVANFVPISKDSTGAREWTIRMVSGQIHFYIIDNSVSDGYLGRKNSYSPAANTWFNLICTYDGSASASGIKIYLDGVRVDDADYIGTGTYVAMENTSAIVSIAMQQGGSVSQPGKIDETAIFNTELTSSQVLEIYNNGRPKDLTTFSGTAPISWWRLGENAYFDNNSFIVPNSITGAPNGTGAGTITTMISADAPGTYANGIGINLDILDRVGDAPLSTSNSQSYNMIPDDKVPYVPGYVGKQIANNFSMSFDGVNDYLQTGGVFSALDGLQKMTLSVWVKPSILDFRHIISIPSIPGNNNNLIRLTTRGSGELWWNVQISSYNAIETTPALNLNQWNHIGLVFDSTQAVTLDRVKIFVNNTRSNITINMPLNKTIGTATGGIFIGENAGGLSYLKNFAGEMDEVAIFDKALTADQIKFDLYQPSLPLGNNKTADIANNTNLPTPVAWYRMGD